MEASSGDPVRKAVVTVTWHGTPRAWATTRTDGSGKFSFEGLPAGKYDLRANKPGLGTATYGANSVRELGDVLTLADGETHSDVKLRFLRSGAISGRVIDPDGDPLIGVNVSILRSGRNLGERVLVNHQGTSTNDRGEYKFTGLDPGEYYLRCLPNLPRPMEEMMAPQYFGGARESKDAAPIYLRGGDMLAGIDFHITSERPATITGRVTGVPPLDPPAEPELQSQGGRMFHVLRNGVNVQLTAADDNQFRGATGTDAQGPAYRFELGENIPGRYRLQATIRSKDKNYYASQLIDAHEGANDVVLAMSPALEVKGHLKLEGTPLHPIESLSVSLAPVGSGMRANMYSANVKKDGSFTMEDVPPGEWILNINPAQQTVFEKSVMLGDQDFLFRRIEIPPGSDAPLNIVLSANTAVVTGEVDAGGRAGILLEPVGKWHMLSRFYYSATADDDGKFKLNAVAPGKYRVYALEKIATLSYRNPESADLLDALVKDLGEDLDIPEGGKVESHPKLIPEEKAKEILKP
jgi:protocatechuate 3,4-dioxygenase beta subunit